MDLIEIISYNSYYLLIILNFVRFVSVNVSSMKRFSHSDQNRSDRLCPGNNFNRGVSSMKHFTEISGADFVKKEPVLNEILTTLNKLSVET